VTARKGSKIFQTKKPRKKYNHQAPDQSEIRLLAQVRKGELCHCTLRAGGVSEAVAHKTSKKSKGRSDLV